MKHALLIPLCSLCLCGQSFAGFAAGGLNAVDATNAIVGEAAGAPYLVKLGVADALHNRAAALRRPLKGVYGFRSPVTRHSAKSVWQDAAKAWLESARHHVVSGALYFGNADDVRKGAFAGLHLTVILGTGKSATYFFKP